MSSYPPSADAIGSSALTCEAAHIQALGPHHTNFSPRVCQRALSPLFLCPLSVPVSEHKYSTSLLSGNILPIWYSGARYSLTLIWDIHCSLVAFCQCDKVVPGTGLLLFETSNLLWLHFAINSPVLHKVLKTLPQFISSVVTICQLSPH